LQRKERLFGAAFLSGKIKVQQDGHIAGGKSCSDHFFQQEIIETSFDLNSVSVSSFS